MNINTHEGQRLGMTKFRVRIKESFVCYVGVEAEDKSKAHDLVEKQVEDCEIVVPRDYDDMQRDISVVRELR